jgi:hypothetical protein
MKFDFKPVKKAIDLGEYAPEMAGAVIQVWVNVSREMLKRLFEVSDETSNEDFFRLLQELWGKDEWPIEDIQVLFEHSAANDPQLWRWITRETYHVITAYQAGQKKE